MDSIIKKTFLGLARRGFLNWMNDEIYLKVKYWARLGRKLDLENPKSFNEKIQWLKLYDRKPEYVRMVDKYEAKNYVAEKIGAQYIIPTLGVWDTFEEIDFGSLPNQFVLKCTHDSGGLVICKDKEKLDIEAAKKTIEESLNFNYYYVGREWPYKNVKPRIIAEKFMSDSSGEDISDYKLMCFKGKVKCSFVCSDRFSSSGLKVTFFDKNWNVLPFERHYPKSTVPIKKPDNYSMMINLAEQLSKNIPFVRVDFYEINGKIYFGELTFYPGSGFEEFTPLDWDYILGDWISINDSGRDG